MKRHHLSEIEDDRLAFLDRLFGDPNGPVFYEGYKPICGAKTRKGQPCRCKLLLKGSSCRFHGGKSTGPRTPEGKARIPEAARRRWQAYRASREKDLR